jgi:hypothetical protein
MNILVSQLPCCRREMTTFQESAFKFVGLIDDANALLFAPLKLELGVDVMLTAHKLGTTLSLSLSLSLEISKQ